MREMTRTAVLVMLVINLLTLKGLSQNAPITQAATVSGAIPGQIAVSVSVTNFTNIGAISLTLDYNYAVIHFSFATPHPQLATCGIGDHDLGNGQHRIVVGWFGAGTSLCDGSVILTLSFTFIHGITSLNWFDNGPSCEYADANYIVLNDVPQSAYYIDGNVCGVIPAPGPVTGNANVCQGETGVNYSIVSLVNATGYTWTVPMGATIVSGMNTNSILVDFSTNSVSGAISVNGSNVCGSGPSAELMVAVHEIPIANAGNDTVIPYGTYTTLHAANGGNGSFTYHWMPETLLIDPNLQNPQTVNLMLTTLFTVLVVNQSSQCHNSDEMIVAISGGPLTVSPVCNPNVVCRGEPSCLYANAGGGSGNYTYSWTCFPPGYPPWSSNQANPIVFPDSSTWYFLTVSDGFNLVTDSTFLDVKQLPTATISGGDTLCGDGNSTIVNVDLTGTPPWSFYYSNGLLTYFISDQYTTPYQIVASQNGVYTILSVSDAHCSGTTSGSAVVAVFPTPPTPVITACGNALFSTGCCGNQWYQDGVLISGATEQTYEPLTTAHYFDIVTLNSCSSDTSNDIYFVMTGEQTALQSDLVITPNPTNDLVSIKFRDRNLKIFLIQLFSVEGKEVKMIRCDQAIIQQNVIIDIQDFPPGLYFIVVYTQSEKIVGKLIVE